MSRELLIRNRQRVRAIHTRELRRITVALLEDCLAVPAYEVGLHLVAAPEMTNLNERFLRHAGSTDVITFDYAETSASAADSAAPSRTAKPAIVRRLHGDIFVCLEDAVKQARQYRTSWQSELTRYVVHGALHLQGYDDLSPAARRVMKRKENRLLRALAQRFKLTRLARSAAPSA